MTKLALYKKIKLITAKLNVSVRNCIEHKLTVYREINYLENFKYVPEGECRL